MSDITAVTSTFHCPITLCDRIRKAIDRSIKLNKVEVSRSNFIRTCLFHYLDYLSEMNEEEIMHVMLDETMPYDGDERKLIPYVQPQGLRDCINELMNRVSKIAGTEKNKLRHSNSLFYNKAVFYWIERLEELRTNKAINEVLIEVKEKKRGKNRNGQGQDG